MSVLTIIGGGGLGSVAGALGSAAGHVAGGLIGGAASSGLDAISAWVLAGTRAALTAVAGLIGSATAPDLTATWFSSTYWRIAGLATLLTLPFVFAAMVQAIMRADLALVGRVAFAYLPLSLLAVSLAAPLASLMLRATDQMSAVVGSVAVAGGARFLDQAAAFAAGLSAIGGSPFLAVMVGVLTVAAALTLAVELLIRAAAVYVVVLMLPLAFAAFVWPARRIWAVRLTELLISLILSKFAIVAVLSLAGSAFLAAHASTSELLTASALLLLATLAPWVLMRLLPFTELAAGATAAMRSELGHMGDRVAPSAGHGSPADAEDGSTLPAMLSRHARAAGRFAAAAAGHVPGGPWEGRSAGGRGADVQESDHVAAAGRSPAQQQADGPTPDGADLDGADLDGAQGTARSAETSGVREPAGAGGAGGAEPSGSGAGPLPHAHAGRFADAAPAAPPPAVLPGIEQSTPDPGAVAAPDPGAVATPDPGAVAGSDPGAVAGSDPPVVAGSESLAATGSDAAIRTHGTLGAGAAADGHSADFQTPLGPAAEELTARVRAELEHPGEDLQLDGGPGNWWVQRDE